MDDAVPHRVELPRRRFLAGGLGMAASMGMAGHTVAQVASHSYVERIRVFRPRALAKNVDGGSFDRVMNSITPDTDVYKLDKAQPEVLEPIWRYLDRRVNEWRIETGRERVKQHAALFDRVEQVYGVDRFLLCALWGMESAFGEVITSPKRMRKVMPCLAALAWREPRRRTYWEQELVNALIIIDRGWAQPHEMIGSWAGAMGHTQWMPGVWLNMGVDFDGDGRINPFGKPDDALAGTARYLVERGKFQRGQTWGYEVRLPRVFDAGLAGGSTTKTTAQWHALGVTSADGGTFLRPDERARLALPAGADGPGFLYPAMARAGRLWLRLGVQAYVGESGRSGHPCAGTGAVARMRPFGPSLRIPPTPNHPTLRRTTT